MEWWVGNFRDSQNGLGNVFIRGFDSCFPVTKTSTGKMTDTYGIGGVRILYWRTC